MRFGFTRRQIKAVTREQEEEFSKVLKENNVDFKERLLMTATAFVTIVLPCLLVLGALSLFTLWVFGAFS